MPSCRIFWRRPIKGTRAPGIDEEGAMDKKQRPDGRKQRRWRGIRKSWQNGCMKRTGVLERKAMIWLVYFCLESRNSYRLHGDIKGYGGEVVPVGMLMMRKGKRTAV